MRSSRRSCSSKPPPALEAEDPATDAGKLGDLEDQVTDAPLALDPKFDFTTAPPESLSGPNPLDHSEPEPEPAPGIKLTIPTN
jgi:hypothetical protein